MIRSTIDNHRGIAHLTLARPVRAIRDFGRGVCAYEVEGDARYAIAQVLAKLGRRREARTECDKAFASNPNLQGAKALTESLREARAES
jgi:tetratricopeptide (TPR) repeat protein